MTVILNSRGFEQLLSQVGFVQRSATRTPRSWASPAPPGALVSQQTTRLSSLETCDRRPANQVLGQRNQVAALQTALQCRVQEVTRSR